MAEPLTPVMVAESIRKGTFKPHIYLTNLALAAFQAPGAFIAKRIFPIVPVDLSSSRFYEFDKGDLARDNVGRKPEFGHVAPAVFGKREQYYHCEVDQVITGIDKISSLDFTRSGAPGMIDPRRAKVRFISEQMNIHQDRVWAKKYFNPGSWSYVLSGVGTQPAGGNQFWFLDNDNCDPVRLFDGLRTAMLLSGLREPNKICMGVNVFAALRTNPSIMERIKYQGSEANPADVTENVLAQLFKLDEIVVAKSVINKSPVGAPDDIEFICDPNSMLLCYTTNAPAIEEPSAGYTFAWDMLGNGQYMAVQQYEGPPATHSEFIEGLICTDPEITAPDLGIFMQNAVSAEFIKKLAEIKP
jgi:hypothetical protein